jgi:hypothetical protein
MSAEYLGPITQNPIVDHLEMALKMELAEKYKRQSAATVDGKRPTFREMIEDTE